MGGMVFMTWMFWTKVWIVSCDLGSLLESATSRHVMLCSARCWPIAAAEYRRLLVPLIPFRINLFLL